MRIVLLGRPNVGKSSLFNAFTRTSAALVAPEPGITRDWREGALTINETEVTLIDTAGIEDGVDELTGKMSARAKQQAQQADVLLYVIDGKDGVLPTDETLAEDMRRLNKPVLVLINKADTKAAEDTRYQAESLGLGDIFMVSAAHDFGLEDVKEALIPHLPESQFEPEAEEEGNRPLPLAIVGRPNAGKSTLINTLTGTNRLLTGDLAGLTRESLDVTWEKDGETYTLVDTPGQRRQAKVVEEIEQQSVDTAREAILRAAVVILVVDVSHYDADIGTSSVFHMQDITIAQHVLDAGKPLILLLNKWDEVKGKDQAAKALRLEIDEKLYDVSNVTILTTSGLTGKGVDKLLPAVKEVYETWSKRVGTAQLNRLLEHILKEKSPPLSKGQPVRLKFISQTGTCPPQFAVWGSRTSALPNSYKRFILKQLRETLGLHGIPLRLTFKSQENPFKSK